MYCRLSVMVQKLEKLWPEFDESHALLIFSNTQISIMFALAFFSHHSRLLSQPNFGSLGFTTPAPRRGQFTCIAQGLRMTRLKTIGPCTVHHSLSLRTLLAGLRLLQALSAGTFGEWLSRHVRDRPGGLSHRRRLALGGLSRSGCVAFNVFSIGTESIRRVRAAQRTAAARDNTTTVHTAALSLRWAMPVFCFSTLSSCCLK